MKIKWYKLKDLAEKNFEDIPTGSGIYFVRWSKNRKPITIPRLGSTDRKGILYIGSAKDLRKRVRELWKGINGQVEAHTVGKTIIFCKISEIISLGEYQISWKELRRHEDAIGQEWSAIEYYSVRYREAPPFNLMLHRHMFTKMGLWILGRSRLGYELDEFAKSVINT